MIQLASQKINFQFSNSDLSSHGGIFLYADFMDRINLKERLRKHISWDDHAWVIHEPAQVIIQKILSLLGGYEDNNDAGEIKYDPVYQQVLKDTIASQPTLSRLEHQADRQTIARFYDLNLELLHQKWQAEGRTELIIDVDSTDSITHGHQPGSAYHGYYRTDMYHPLFIFEGQTGDLIKATLRHGNTGSAHKIVGILTPVIEQLLAWGYTIKLRADSGMNDPYFYEQCERWGAEYIIRLKKNSRLAKKAVELLPIKKVTERVDDVVYSTFDYQADSWNHDRLVHAKQIYRPDQLFPEYYFILTNNIQDEAEDIFDCYEDRGTAENYIKESKLDLFSTRLSCTTFWANAFRLQLSCLAYNVNNFFRSRVLPDNLKSHFLSTLRVKLINIGCRIVKHARRIICQFGKSFRIKKLFNLIIQKLKAFHLSLPSP
jgi:hypothetical protein